MQPRTSSLYEVEVLRTVEAVESVRDDWKTMPSRIEADIDFFLQFARVYRNFVVRPHVIVLRRNGKVATILPGRLERHSLKVRVGYKDVVLPTANQITFVGQLLGESSRHAAEEITESARISLKNKEADVAQFHQIDSREELYEAVENLGGFFTRDYFGESEENWTAQITGDYGDFLKKRSHNTRYNVKRYSKRLLQAFSGKVQHKTFSDLCEIDVIFKDCETIAAKSYHRGLGVGFFDNEASREIFRLGATKGWLKSYILYVNGLPAAFWNGFLYRGTFLIWDTAFDASLSELRPGLYLLQRIIEDLCTEGSAHQLDFGPGTAQYKRDMSDTTRVRVSKLLFAPTPKAIWTNVLRTPLLALSHTAKWTLKRSGFLGKAKRAWRSRLVPADRVEDAHREAAVTETSK